MSGRLFVVVVVVVGEREKGQWHTQQHGCNTCKTQKQKRKLGDCKTIDREKKVFSAD